MHATKRLFLLLAVTGAAAMAVGVLVGALQHSSCNPANRADAARARAELASMGLPSHVRCAP